MPLFFVWNVMSTGVALIAIGAAMKIFASAVKDFGQLQWDEIGRGLTAMGGALAEVAIAVNLMPKNMIGIGTGLVIVGGALEIIANCMSKFGGMQWEEIGRGLTIMGGALAELAISLNFMKGTIGGSAALLVASGALAVLAPVLSILGALSWEAIAKGLISIAGAFTIIGVAGAVLTPLVPTILALSGAFALIGVGVLTIGAGLLAAGTGLSALAIGFTALATAGAAGATAIVAALTVIVTGIASLIPAVLTKVGEGLVAICKVIAAGAPAIGEAVKAVVLTLIDVLVSCVPQLADGALRLVVGVLAALVAYTPQIVDLAFKFLIGILEGIASNLPSLIKAGIDVLVAFFAGIVDALSGIDTGALLKGIAGIGLLSAIMLALSATAALVPGAMVGILGMGAVVAEMALVLAAVGLLSKLPGLSWLIGEGGKLLQGIGTAIGQFVGGIVGGFMSGVSSQFPQIGADLSAFMNNVQPFLQGASQIQPSMMDGVKALAETVLILTAADILQGLTSWLTGGSSLSKFGEELVPFGEAMRDFSLAIGNMDGEIVANAATAGKALAEMAATIPNTGGLVSFFAGENDMTAFGKQLVPFGEAMRQFGDAITGLDANAVTEAAIAGKAMAEMATTIPNSGGVVGFFAGENDMGEFGKQLVPFGEAMKAFGDAVRGLEADAIVNSATAGKALVELADTVPNTGGVVAFFTGNNDVNTFGEKLVPFGEAMKAYSEAIMGMDSAAVTNSATAGKALVELANTIPNTGGLVSWFTGDNDLGSFGDSLVQFGSGIKSYSDSISGIDTGIMSSVITQVNRLVEMAKGSIQIRDRIVRHSLCDEVLLPEVRKHIIYDNCASIKGRGISQQRKRFEIHLHKYYQLYGNDGYILFGDFSKFYDNIIHEIAKRELLKLFNDDEFIDWLLTLIFKGFQIDVSYMSDEEYETCMIDTFNKLEYRNIPKEKLTGEKWMEKSVNIGDQLSQVIGIYYPYPIDNYVKYVRQQKFYGRYMDDWYIMNPSKEELEELLENVCKIAAELGIHINRKKTRIVKISSKYKFLQIKYTLTDTGKVIKRINPDRVTAMRRKLKKLAVKVEHEEADYDNVENMFRGWMGGHYKLLSREQRKNLIQLYEDLFSKEITIVNKKLIVSDRSA